LPNLGLVTVVDSESNHEMIVDTSDKSVRLAYENDFIEKEHYFQKTFYKCGAGIVQLHLEESYVKKLLGYFKSR